jgi:lipopolysaccharide transport system permease protein
MSIQPTIDADWDLVIKSKSSLFDLRLNDVWRYRDLLLLFVKRDFISGYKQTILGPLWFFIQPLFTTITFTFVFGNLAGLSSDGVPKPLFYMAGITAWGYFADCLTKTSTVFTANAGIFGKVYFPRLIMPLTIVVSNLMRFGVQLIMFVILLIYFAFVNPSFQLTSALFLFPFLLLLMALLGLGLGMIISALTTKYRDLQFLIQFGVTLLMYATPVIYPLSSIPAEYKKWIILNPMTAVIEAFRYGFLGKGDFSIWSLGYTSLVTVIILLVGIVYFNKTERTFIDTV